MGRPQISRSTYKDDVETIKQCKPLNLYGQSKQDFDLWVLENDLYGKVVGLKFFNVFGPKQDPDGAYAAVIPLFMKAAMEGKAPVINGDGTFSRDFTYVANAVQANMKALFTENVDAK